MKKNILEGYTEAAEMGRLDGGLDDTRGFPVST